MKHIIKGAEPLEIIEWKGLANDDWTPEFSNLDTSPKQALHKSLLSEQGFLCCYCESEIDDRNSHIEHLCPQSAGLVDPLDYSNMLVSCQSRLQAGEPRHCGHKKGDWYVHELLVSPLDRTCEERFRFSGDGRIRPASKQDKGAKTTIRKLGLDIEKLNDLRRNAMIPFLDEGISEQDFFEFVKKYLERGVGEKFNPYWTTIRQQFANGL